MNDKELRRNKIDKGIMIKVLDYTYDKAVGGVKGLDSAEEMALSYMYNGKEPMTNANDLIKWQIAKAATSGFLTGVGGLITLPFTIPANIGSVIYVQIRMIAALAYMGGYDLKDDRVKTMIYICLVGNGAKELLKEIGVNLGKQLSLNLIKSISSQTITAINQKVGFCLLTKFGEKGIVNMGKSIPIVGGVIGGSIDSFSTNAIGKLARKTFIKSNNSNV